MRDRALQELHDHLDRVRFNGNRADFSVEKERIAAMLAHFVGVYCQQHTPVLIGDTKVRWSDFLAARLLGLIYVERGYLEDCAKRAGHNGNFLRDASSKFFVPVAFPWHVS